MKNRLSIAFTTFFLAFSHQAYSLPSFTGDFESGTITGAGNNNWADIQVVAPDRFTLINNDATHAGTYARVEVRNGDNPLAAFCCAGTSRAEVLNMKNADGSPLNENLSSGTQKFSFSVKFDQSWQIISDISPNKSTGAWGIFTGLHGPDMYGTSGPLAFSATDEIRLITRGGDLVNNTQNVEHDLSNGDLNIGQWIDFQLTIKFADDNTGFINVMRRNEGETNFTEVLNLMDTPTLQYRSDMNNGAVLDHYWKHGLYRNEQAFTSVLYLDGFTREAVTAVPEPETYVLMLVGLTLINFRARRQNKA